MKKHPKTFMNWSSGKDSSMALHAILQAGELDVEKLVTSVNKHYNRVSMHGLHRSLLEAQAQAIGIPLDTIEFGENPSMEDYEQTMTAKITQLSAEGYRESIFGDIFLEDLREYREKLFAPSGIRNHYPLWKKNTRTLLQEFIHAGFKAIVVCCQASKLSEEFCGRIINEEFLADLPKDVDPCGENGEFHTFCFDGPIFKYPIPFIKKRITYKSYPAPKSDDPNAPQEFGFWFADLEIQ